jgi:hypothetical protein
MSEIITWSCTIGVLRRHYTCVGTAHDDDIIRILRSPITRRVKLTCYDDEQRAIGAGWQLSDAPLCPACSKGES